MKNRKGVLYFLREVIIVVIGVLIAVSLGNLKERIENNNYLEKTLLAIESEIKISQAEVDSVLQLHNVLADSLENYDFVKEQTLGEMISSLGGFQAATIKNISLRFFIANKAELLEFNLISQLLEIEYISVILSDKIKRLVDFTYDNINNSDLEVMVSFSYLLSDVIDSEKSLTQLYANFLKENKAYLNNNDPQ